MKQKRFTLLLTIVMFVGLASHAQDVITGDRLDIGSGNELNSQYYSGVIGMQNSCESDCCNPSACGKYKKFGILF